MFETPEWVGHPAVQVFVLIINTFVILYVLSVTLTYTILTVVGWRGVTEYARRRPIRDYDYVAHSPLSTPVTVLVPAYNESTGIVSSVNSLLLSEFQAFDIVVINDGSTDDTLEVLKDAFGLVEIPRVPRSHLPTAHVRAIYTSPTDQRIVVIDKENGGKSDALNAGINYSRYPLFCAIDADTIIDPEAVARLVWEFQSDPATVAVGGIVRVANGTTSRNGRLIQIRTPKDLLANIQVIEYLRAFLAGRVGWSQAGMLLIVSGAFGMFRREVVVDAGGYDVNTVGEDAELILRLHRHCREAQRDCRIGFVPDPVCWTEVPSSMKVLARQRDRWQRGLAQTLWKHRGMTTGSHGRLSAIALPYFWLIELAGPIIEVLGYISVPLAVFLGIMSVEFALLLIGAMTVYAVLLSLVIVLLEERQFRRYPYWSDLWRMVIAVIVENFGYRQYLAFVRTRAMFRLRKHRTSWGDMERVGFAEETAAPNDSQAVTSGR